METEAGPEAETRPEPDKAQSQSRPQAQGQKQLLKQEAFRNWLEHHESSPGIWMVYYKKHTDSRA